MSQKIGVDQLADIISQKMQEYAGEVEEQIRENVGQVCKEAVLDLRKNSPRKTGEYARGWAKKVVADKKGRYVLQIYNKEKPSLTHLLEYGHKQRGGGMVAARQHIRPVEERSKQKIIGKAKVTFK